MSSTPPTGGRLLVEPLEARIAPTGLTALANDPNDPAVASASNYVTYHTAPAAGKLGFVPASHYLGASAPANLYAIALSGDGSVNSANQSTGDALLIFNSTTGFNLTTPSLQAANKTLVAFFQDTNGDGQVQANELVGLALTKQSSVNVNGNVNGDIVTNLSKDGTTINLTSVGKPGFAIDGLQINGNVTGNILAGGNINNVDIIGTVGYVLAGSATNNVHYNFTGNTGATTGTIAEPGFAPLKPGASISNLTINALTPGHTIHAGDGGIGGVGGSVTSLLILNETGAMNVIAGNGGVGTSTIKGGVGGDISLVTIVGVADTIGNQLISLHAGNGGADDAFKGGVGGSIDGVGTSFNQGFDSTTISSTSPGGTVSPDLLTQNFILHAGDGGSGLRGGRGGDVTSSSIFSAAPDDGIVTNGVANAEIQIIAGAGGQPISTTAGHGGKGGNVAQVFAEDQNPDVTNADHSITDATDSVLVQAGNGVAGKDGGNLNAITLLGAQITANAGNGGSGILTGGPGGSLDTITISSLPTLFTHQLTLNAGSGGASQQGPGGDGGSINMVTMLDSDLNLLNINTATSGGVRAGDGGAGSKGVGGAGGGLTNIQLTDSDYSGQFATVTVRSGAGGGGYLGGGAGGDIGNSTSPVQMFGSNFSFAVTAGNGGTVLPGGSGAGGNGGSLDTVGFSSAASVDPISVGSAITSALTPNYTEQFGTATAGRGGDGTNHGGAGGSLSAVDLRASYDLILTAGTGGAGGVSAGGAGGSIVSSAGVSLGGAVSVIAGPGSTSGSLAADGGGISGVIVSAQTNITMTAGKGGVGGNGGDITGSGTTPNPLYVDFAGQSTSNFGNVTITAGSGTSANGVAGAGGSVTNFTGSIGLGGSGDFNNFDPHTTAIIAGAGGGGSGQTASGAGGTVSSLQLTGNNLTDLDSQQIVTIDGGAAGMGTSAKRGGAGGDVSTSTLYNLDTGTVIQHVAAGDGANGVNRGGIGGTVSQIHVGRPGDTVADIGVRSGAAFGYGPGDAGGLFAGVGGTGKKSTGVNGDVTDITANAISSIVAGKTSTIHLVDNVNNIFLEGSTVVAVNADGSISNFDTANIVGSVENPTAAGATTFHTGDGLVAATNFTSNVDFTPEAILTFNGGKLEFTDYQLLQAPPYYTTTIPVAYAL